MKYLFDDQLLNNNHLTTGATADGCFLLAEKAERRWCARQMKMRPTTHRHWWNLRSV